MKSRYFAGTFISMLFCHFGYSQWNTNSTINTPIAVAANTQKNVSLSSDTKKGAFIIWEDKRNGTSDDVYAQRINSAGVNKWAVNGVPVCINNAEQNSISSVEDGNGGVIITWDDYRNGESDIYAQRLDSNGVALWATNGVPVCSKPLSQKGTKLVSDGAGGAIVVWQDSLLGSTDIYAQRISNTGTLLWTSAGVPICTSPLKQIRPRIQSDNAGGAFIVWQDRRMGVEPDIYAQRINGSGNPLWAVNGVVVCNAINSQSYPKMRADGSNGVIIAWQDKRNALDFDIYAQRLNASGTALWATNGVPIAVAADNQEELDIITDGGSNGIIICWADHRSFIANNSDIYVQKIDLSGNPLWTLNGIALTGSTFDQKNANIVGDGSGGAIVVWQDSVPGSQWDVRSQKLNSNGAIQWALNGINIGNAANSQAQVGSIADGAGGCIYAWEDKRNGLDDDIYAQHSPFTTVGFTTEDFSAYGGKVFPSPFNSTARLIINNKEKLDFENGVIRFTNLAGNEVFIRYTVNENGYLLFKENTPPGVYFYDLNINSQRFVGKLIVGE
ncbi:MAG: T9SS type A sorting domain-containing protein [Bacteroidetes bacterium]|nr:T9SS type A sorting domain-containing protein [Bacteroidota bacterium]MCA6442314.1 T9SS type A sorting domain-containing protein [Bacteroidota bacterium]